MPTHRKIRLGAYLIILSVTFFIVMLLAYEPGVSFTLQYRRGFGHEFVDSPLKIALIALATLMLFSFFVGLYFTERVHQSRSAMSKSDRLHACLTHVAIVGLAIVLVLVCVVAENLWVFTAAILITAVWMIFMREMLYYFYKY